VNVTRSTDNVVERKPWGRLEWQVGAALGNSETMTVGRCFLDPGQANARHVHPNCDEVLSVLRGTIVQIVDEEEVVMHVGDTVSVPAGSAHQARNIGDTEAELAISFSSAFRETVDV
jgi:oxalate decarboxylase/phosphoglucose isomerase-like protein (cupin superfamily)